MDSKRLTKEQLIDLNMDEDIAEILDAKLTLRQAMAIIMEFNRRRIRRDFSNALAHALRESHEYHRSVLTGRCL